jgi:23S rRNA (adenine2503-C2)-methyltransferase
MSTQIKQSLTGMTRTELVELLSSIEEPAYRADQLHHWVYIKSAASWEQMSNVSKVLKQKLATMVDISATQIVQRLMSTDGTIKYLLEFGDGARVETVLMRFDNRPNLTACVSTQVGCPVQCVFCATGKRGFIRNLTHTEMVDQILTIQRDTGLKVSNIVFMGQGEPLFNYKNLVRAIHLLNESMEIGTRRITVSTAGVIPEILKLGNEFPQLTLAVSLHAASPEIRKTLVPLENKFSTPQLIKTLKEYYNINRRRVTIEYVLIKDINDSLSEAKKLNTLLKDLHCNINLIPYNVIDPSAEYKSPEDDQVKMFKYILELSGKKVTVRLKRGNDIAAACGQLTGHCVNEENSTQ